MTIYSEISNGILLLRPSQAIDYTTAEGISEHITVAANEGIIALVLDLTEVDYACARVLRILLDFSNGPGEHCRHTAIVGASRQFHSLIKTCGADLFIMEYPSIEKARAALNDRIGNVFSSSTDPEEEIAADLGEDFSPEDYDDEDDDDLDLDDERGYKPRER